MDDVIKRLRELADADYASFMAKLVPNVDPSTIVGVRMPALRTFARSFADDPAAASFMGSLPHAFYEENVLHAILLASVGDYDDTVAALDAFLPYVDNWAVCDAIAPRCFGDSAVAEDLKERALCWVASEAPYTARFGIGVLMRHFLKEGFDPAHFDAVCAVESEDYYVNMMRAWYFATALDARWDEALRIVEERRLDPWTHRKAIQKAVESRRIPDERKALLRTLR